MKKFLSVVGLLIFLLAGSNAAEAKINLFARPRYVPALSFYGDSGKAYRLSDFQENLLMAVVWSRYCVPCLADLRNLSKFVEQTKDQGIKVILISPEKEWKTPDERRAFMKRLGAKNLVSFLDRRGNFRDGMGIQVTPTTLLINKDGEEIGQITGAVEWDNSKVVQYMLKLKDKVSQEL